MLDFDRSPVLTSYEVRKAASSKSLMASERKKTDDEAVWRGLLLLDLPTGKGNTTRTLAQVDLHSVGGEAHFSPNHAVFVALRLIKNGVPQALEEYEIHEDMHGIAFLQTGIEGLNVKRVRGRGYLTQDRSPNVPLTPREFKSKVPNPKHRQRIMMSQAIVNSLQKCSNETQ